MKKPCQLFFFVITVFAFALMFSGCWGANEPTEIEVQTNFNWTLANNDIGMQCVNWCNDRFIGGGGGPIWYSIDGISWTDIPITNTTYNYHSIEGSTFGNGIYVTVWLQFDNSHPTPNTKTIIAYSHDGITWTQATQSIFGNKEVIYGIAWGNGKFVAIGWQSGYPAKIAYSVNGKDWTQATQNIFDGTHMAFDITYGNGKFVAVGLDRIGYSSDGVTWTAANTSFDNPFNYYNCLKVTWGNGRFVAVGYSGFIAYSFDGVNWTAVVDNPFTTVSPNDFFTITWGGDMFVAGGGNTMGYSYNGINWTAITTNMYIYDIAWGNNKFVACDGSNVTYSPIIYTLK